MMKKDKTKPAHRLFREAFEEKTGAKAQFACLRLQIAEDARLLGPFGSIFRGPDPVATG